MFIGIYIDIFIDIYIDIFIDIYIDIFIDISIDIFIDIYFDTFIDILTDKEGGRKEEWRKEGGVDLFLKSNNPNLKGGEKSTPT